MGWYITPLHAVIAKEIIDVTTFLLEHGADVTAWNYNSKTPLHEASQRAHLDAM
jgi:ankyrin repeat protein